MNSSELLFDNRIDPNQTTNLATNPTHSDKLAVMREKMNRKMESISDDFQTCTWYRDHWTDNRVIIRSGPGDIKRYTGKTIVVDVNYSPLN